MHPYPLTHAALLMLVLCGFLASSCTLRNTATLENAVDSGNVDAVRRHLNEGTDVNKTDEEGRTPLHISARNGSKKVAEVLIERGANVEVKDHEGQTPLHLAAKEGHAPMVDLLLTKGAAVNSRDEQARTPLHHAAFGRENETPLMLLAKGAAVDATDKKGWTPLYLAALNNRPKMAELLINKGATVNPAKSPSPLMGAVRDGHTQVVKVLLDYKAPVHGPSNASTSPLHLAAEKGYFQIAELLIEHQASPDRKDQAGNTPLYYATYNDHPQVMRILIKAKADVNQNIPEGTLLHLAAQRGSREGSRLLLEHGAELEVKNAKGQRPLDVAINNGQRGIADMITAEMIKRREVGK
jgi:uncharacterized protein